MFFFASTQSFRNLNAILTSFLRFCKNLKSYDINSLTETAIGFIMGIRLTYLEL